MNAALRCCDDKRQYGTKEAAKRALRRWGDLEEPRIRFKAYHCDECGYFHLGHKAPVGGTKELSP